MRKLTSLFTFIIMLVTAISGANAAQKINELQYIKTCDTESDGKSVFRIEIGLKNEIIDYDVKIPFDNSDWLYVNFNDTVPGKLNRHNSGKIFLSGKETVSIKETKINFSSLQWNLPFEFSADRCKVYIEKKPHKLVIDIEKPGSMTDAIEVEDNNYKSTKGRIVIDAGHGGKDSGAVGSNGVKEKDVTLAVAFKVKRLLENAGEQVVMTRTTDSDVAGDYASNGVELQSRVDKTPKGAVVFVSIHCNAFSNPNSNGMETYYYGGSAEGKRIATILNEELANHGGRFNRGVKPANYYLLKHAKVKAASLVELAFVTNPTEERLLADDSYQEELAIAIANGIQRYLSTRS